MLRLICVSVLAATCLPLLVPAAEFYVSPHGKDVNPGSQQRPLATLAGARDAVRVFRHGHPDEDVTVWIGDGTYRLTETLVFFLEDSGARGRTITYAAAPGARPVLSGAMPVHGWTCTPRTAAFGTTSLPTWAVWESCWPATGREPRTSAAATRLPTITYTTSAASIPDSKPYRPQGDIDVTFPSGQRRIGGLVFPLVTRTCSPAVLVAISLAAAPLLFRAARAQEPRQDSQKLLLGFEKEELLRSESVSREEKPGKTWFYLLDQAQGFDFAARFEVPGETNRAWTWACRPGEHTQGELALVASVGPANPNKLPPTYRQTDFLSFYYPSLKGREAQLLLTTFQWLAKGRSDLRDWRGYDLLRIDARCDDSPLQLRLAVEDDVLEPPVLTTYSLPQGRWMTIELDLGEAVRARELDLSRIANFWLLGVAQRAAKMRLDNVRLAKRGTPAGLDVLRDPRPLAVTYNRPPKPQLPERGELPEPDRSPIPRGEPVVVAKGTHTMFSWVAAWDNNHLFVTLADCVALPLIKGHGPRGACKAIQSRDGGKTWVEVGSATVAVLDHQSTRGQAIDPWGDGVAVASTPGCAGIGKATPRFHVTKYTFTATGWEARLPDILDADLRHCGWNAAVTRVLRGPFQGRLWASWGQIDRNHAVSVHVKYSDDDGRTWIPWGRGAELPGSSRGWWNDTYMYPVTAITPYGDHVAVFWQHLNSRETLWSRYGADGWSNPEVVPDLSARWSGAYQAVSLVTVGEKEVFVTATGLGTVLRWDGLHWQREPVSVEDGSLCLAGETLTVFSSGKAQSKRIFNYPATRKAVLSYLWRTPEGRWEGPVALVPEFTIEELRSMPGFSVPRYSPPNFVPLAWGDADEGVVKFLRVPIPTRPRARNAGS